MDWKSNTLFILIILIAVSVVMVSGHFIGSLFEQWLGIDPNNQTLSFTDYIVICLLFFTYSLSKRVDHLTKVIDSMQNKETQEDD